MFSKLKRLLKKSDQTSSPSPETNSGHNEDLKTSPPDPAQAKKSKKLQSNTRRPLAEKKIKYRSRQNLPVFHDDQNFEDLFDGGDDDALSPDNPDYAQKKESFPRTTPAKKKVRRDKHGFPILDSHDDLESALKNHGDRENGKTKEPRKDSDAKPVKVKQGRTRHGIRILDDHETPFEADGTDNPQAFEDLLYKSLGDKAMDVLLHEKEAAEKKRKPLTLKQKLKYYPDPQGQLDLHGYTAVKADSRVEAYLKNAYYNGTHTVILIVGKGLHSPHGAVLPDVVEDKLKNLKKDGLVLSYEWENKRKSKSGAVLVYLDNRLR